MSRYAEAHRDPHGPGDARPTALRIIQDEDLIGKLTGKVVMITGCSDGIGLETARAIHATGATVFAANRNEEKTKAAIEKIYASDPENKAPIHFIKIELDSFASVRAAAKEFLAKSNQLNVLINNAGIMAVPEGRTVDGFERQFGTNHLGHFLLFELLKPTLLASSTPSFPSRVVSVSSMGHRFGEGVRFDDFNFEKEPYDIWKAYGQSKCANIYFANEIERRYGPRGLHATSLHPGAIWTNLATHLPPEQTGFFNTPEAKNFYMKNAEQGAATTVWAAVGQEWANKGGRFLANCEDVGPHDPNAPFIHRDGYYPWTYNEAAEKRLWKESLKMVGLSEDTD